MKENKILPLLQRTSTANADLSAVSTLNRRPFDSLILVLFTQVVKYALLSEYQGVICLSQAMGTSWQSSNGLQAWALMNLLGELFGMTAIWKRLNTTC